jgi:hypothetical protein
MIEVTDVKSHLVGLGPWLDAAAQCKFRYDDKVIATKKIPQVVRTLERETLFRINPIQVVSSPDGTYDSGQSNYSTLPSGRMLLIEDGYTYRREMAQEYFTIQLRQWPATTVQRVRVVIGTSTVFTMPAIWYSLESKTATFSIQPVYGPLLISSLNAFSALEFTFGAKDYLRNAIKVDYQAGLPVGWESLSEFADIYKWVCQAIALQILEDVSELADAGLISVSAGGDTRTYSRFKDRKEELKAAVDNFRTTLQEQETPVMLGFV